MEVRWDFAAVWLEADDGELYLTRGVDERWMPTSWFRVHAWDNVEIGDVVGFRRVGQGASLYDCWSDVADAR